MVLSLVNYDSTLQVQPEETLEAIIDINFTIPLVLSVVGLVLSLVNNLDKVYPTVVRDLKIRRAEEARKLGIADAQ